MTYDPTDHVVALVNAMMRSADTDNISPRDWWPRATSALITAAAAAVDYPAMVSTMARKLQIETLTQESAEAVAALRNDIPEWETFRRFAERDAAWCVAVLRASRPKRQPKEKPEPTPTTIDQTQEIPF